MLHRFPAIPRFPLHMQWFAISLWGGKTPSVSESG